MPGCLPRNRSADFPFAEIHQDQISYPITGYNRFAPIITRSNYEVDLQLRLPSFPLMPHVNLGIWVLKFDASLNFEWEPDLRVWILKFRSAPVAQFDYSILAAAMS